MLFRKRTRIQRPSAASARVSPAETAHLFGPGCVKLVGAVPVWKPVDGRKLKLHPKYLKRVLCYGNVDFSTASLRLLWKRKIQVTFISPHGNRILGRLSPAGKTPNLPRLHHLAAANRAFQLNMARQIVQLKIDATIVVARYYQRQGKARRKRALQAKTTQPLVGTLKKLCTATEKATNVDSLRGLEGAAAAAWFRFIPTILTTDFSFERRKCHPAVDPVNALLSLGYSMAHHRCETLLTAADLDANVGFLHEVRPGRSSLACDLVEPLRPFVDRLVIGMLNRKTFTKNDFSSGKWGLRLQREALRRFLDEFEQAFHNSDPSWHDSSWQLALDWAQQIRQYHK